MVSLSHVKSPVFVVKVVELLMTILCTGLIAGLHVANAVWKEEMVHVTVMGFIIIYGILILAHLSHSELDQRLLLLISGLAVVLYVMAGAFMIELYASATGFSDRILGSGILSIIIAVISGVDTFITYKHNS